MIHLKNEQEIKIMRESGRLAAEVLDQLCQKTEPGITTQELDRFAEKLIRQRGAQPSFKGYKGYPAAICVSVNEEIVHGLPSQRQLKNGDVVGIDLGVFWRGFHTDVAATVIVGGKTEKEVEDLVKTTYQALYKALEATKPGNHISDISKAIFEFIEGRGFSVVKDCTGHGIGREIHEEPSVPNFITYDKKTGEIILGPELKEGMVIAIEPMAALKMSEVYVKDDGWTIATKDNSYTAHFEHTVAITQNGYEVLTQL